MAGMGMITSLLLQLLYFTAKILAFNLDTAIPIVKEGVQSSYFGYSVAQHQILQIRSRVPQHVFLVGAPRDNVTSLSSEESVRALKRPGVVYSCPISSFRDDCTSLEIDREVPRGDEDKNDQWLGVSVESQGTSEGMAMACAHRYKTVGPGYVWGKGICISMTNTLDEDEYIEPCAAQPTDRGHGQYGFCQTGTGLDLDKDGTYVVGTPGPYNWRGAIWKNIFPRNITQVAHWYNSPVEDPTVLQPDLPKPQLPYYANLGMSVKIGKVLGGKTFVAGAPRSRYVGEVLLYRQGQEYLDIDEMHHLMGEQFGSCFGYDIALVDFDSDGREDIAVGAPFYSARGVGGAIYIFMNGPQGITNATKPIKIENREMTVQECKDLKCHDARFGFALENIGDVDLDGFQDLAVGAPYEGNGVVYIFRGSKDGIIPEYSQRIAASDLLPARPLSTFGYSLSGGNDMDGNGYPDVVVGAYDANKALVLRARPVINIISSLYTTPVEINPKADRCPLDGRPNNCFKVTVCFRFTAEPQNEFDERIDLDYTIVAEKLFGKKTSRVIFKNSPPDARHMVEKSVQLNKQTNPDSKCRDHLAIIVKNNKDFLNPINLQLTYRLKETPPPTMVPGQQLPNINSYPVLNEAAAMVNLPVHFVKNCGADKECHSNLTLRAHFNLPGDPRNPVFKVGQRNELELVVVVRNYGEDAHEASLTLLLPETISFINTEPRGMKCDPLRETNMVMCSLGNPLRQGNMEKFKIRMDPTKISSATKELHFQLRVNTTSTEVDTYDDTKMLKLTIVLETDLLVRGASDPAEVFYGGEIIGESAVNNEDQIGQVVVHNYEVKNSGKGKVANSTVYISWPYQVEMGYELGKHLLYLLEEPQVDAPGRCKLLPWMVDPLDVRGGKGNRLIDSRSTSDERNRRRAKKPPQPVKIREGGRTLRVVTLNCTNGNAKCFTFECAIGELHSGDSVVIRMTSRLWNSTFLMDFRNVDYVLIQSSAHLAIDEALNIKQTDERNDYATADTKAYPDVETVETAGPPLWVIILAVCGGLLLLIIIILLLWKCGFFKRKRPDDMRRKGKLEKQKNYYEDEYN